MEKSKTPVGVLIGRFQVPDLHKGHRGVIDAVFERHKKVLILLGCSPVRMSSNNPLDYITRERMIKRAYPEAIILPINDCSDNKVWSKTVDSQIASAVGDTAATLYGSRDSFIPFYSGKYATVELPASVHLSGTEARAAASEEVRSEKAFRAGVIYSCFNRYAISYQCVDAIIWREETQEILLGRKRDDAPGLWRFLGGFVGPEDDTLEAAATREAMEETGGLGLHTPQYLCSVRVQDWRYKKERDRIMTAVFKVPYMFGIATPSDDIDELRWTTLEIVKPNLLVPEHREIWVKAVKFFP